MKKQTTVQQVLDFLQPRDGFYSCVDVQSAIKSTKSISSSMAYMASDGRLIRKHSEEVNPANGVAIWLYAFNSSAKKEYSDELSRLWLSPVRLLNGKPRDVIFTDSRKTDSAQKCGGHSFAGSDFGCR